MIRLLRAFAWLRWRLLLNSFRGSGRRDSLERASRALSVLLPIILVVLFIPAVLGGSVVSFLGGWAMGTRRIEAAGVIAGLRVLLGLFTVGVVIAPALRSVRGVSTGVSRFILLPIPVGFLFLSDAILGLFDPWFMILIPALVMFPVGLAVAGQFGLAAIALIGGFVFLVLLLALETTVSNVLNLLYRNRRRGEAATLLILFCLSLVGTVPFIMGRFSAPHRARGEPRAATTAESQTTPESPGVPEGGRSSISFGDGSIGVTLPLRVLPSELYGRAIALANAGRIAPALVRLALLAALAGALLAISWTTYGRLLSTPDVSGRFGKGARSRTLALRLPGLSGPSSAVAVASVKVVLRSVSGKMAVYFSPVSMCLLVFILSRLPARGGHGGFGMDQLGPYVGPAAAGAAAYLGLTTMGRFMLNQFAIDGAGSTLQLLSPLSGRQMVIGKIAGMGCLYAVPCAVYALATVIFFPHAPLLLWIAVLVSVVGTYVLYAPITSILSALFPRPADLSRIGKSSSPSTIASLSGFAVASGCFTLFAGVCACAMLIWNSPLVALVLAFVGTGAAFALSTQLVMIAARVLDSRRENLALVAQGR